MARDLNLFIATGNVGSEPEERTFGSGYSITTFSFAVNHPYKDKSGEWQTKTSWFQVEVSDGVDVFSIVKGARINVQGSLMIDKFQKSDGSEGVIVKIRKAFVSPDPLPNTDKN